MRGFEHVSLNLNIFNININEFGEMHKYVLVTHLALLF